jgi:DNA-directed RNA polymerase subunit RPC12/RpoP
VNYIEFKEKTEARGGDDSIDNILLEIIKLESLAVKEEEKKLSCPICSWMLNGNETVCPKCGKSFVEDVTFQCPVCGSLVSADAVRCSECGSTFEEEAEGRAAAHQQASSALDEIMSVASSAPEERRPPEPAPMVEPERQPQYRSKVTSIFGRRVDTPKEGPKKSAPAPEVVREPEPAPEPEPVPAPVVLPEPEPEARVEPPEPIEPERTPEPEEPKPSEASQPKKSRQRKLKAKPKH